MISYFDHNDINKNKWDHCIRNASNGLIYGRYDYLEAMSKNWDALVMNDYEFIMPLTWKRKYGVFYLYQPFFCASLGIFGNNITHNIVEAFFENIPLKFKYWDIYLNMANYYEVDKYPFTKRSNFILDLNHPYEKIFNSYSVNHKRNLSRAVKSNLQVKKDVSIEGVIFLAKAQAKNYSPIKSVDYERFKNIYNILLLEGNAVSYGVYTLQNTLLASGVFFFYHNRAYYILVGNHPYGRKAGASHFLINEFIKDFSNKSIVLDFEGSNIKSIARFYQGFGAKEENYPGLKLNRLPAVLKLIRK